VLCSGLQVRNAGHMITPRQSIEVCLEQTRELTPTAPANDEVHSAFIDTRLSPGESFKPEKVLHFAIAYPRTLPPLDAKPEPRSSRSHRRHTSVDRTGWGMHLGLRYSASAMPISTTR
jgi:hypothetical protein